MIFQTFDIPKAAELIRLGELVAFPTETVYGLGASVFLPEAIQKIFQVKGRPQDNPLIVHISDLKQLEMIVQDVPESFYLLAKAFFPGPLTVLLKKKECVPAIVSANLETIGVRMPAHELALKLIEAVGVPLVAPSANISGRPSSTRAEHVVNDFAGHIAGVLDGGPCGLGIESTVLALDPVPTILRPGAIGQKELEAVLGVPVLFAGESVEKPASPGMKYRHYAPRAKVLVFETQKDLEVYLSLAGSKKRTILYTIRQQDLYASFRQADVEGKEEILILCDETVQKNRALMNRIHKAACS